MRLLIDANILAAAASGGGVCSFLGYKAAGKAEHAKPVVIPPPVFVPMETFTVNLQFEDGEQFLQTAFTLQVAAQADVDAVKLYLPQVRSRILLLFSKRGADILTGDGKKKLADAILVQMKLPFASNAKPLKVTDVFFTSFVIQ